MSITILKYLCLEQWTLLFAAASCTCTTFGFSTIFCNLSICFFLFIYFFVQSTMVIIPCFCNLNVVLQCFNPVVFNQVLDNCILVLFKCCCMCIHSFIFIILIILICYINGSFVLYYIPHCSAFCKDLFLTKSDK